MPTPNEQSKKKSDQPTAAARIVAGVTTRELFRLSRRMGVSPEQFERLSGESAHKLRRGRGGDEVVAEEKLEAFRRCDAIFQRAVALCGGNEDAATKWVSADAPALKGKKPIEAAETPAGYKSVEKLLAQLEGAVSK